MNGEGGVWKAISSTTNKIADSFADMALSWVGLATTSPIRSESDSEIIADLIREVTRWQLSRFQMGR